MKIPLSALVLSASLIAFATPAAAAVTITFAESTTEGANPNPTPIVEGAAAGSFTAFGGIGVSVVTLINFFPATPEVGFAATYNMLEPQGTSNENIPGIPAAPGVSDQVTFANVGKNLVITFTSDPLNLFLGTPYDFANETGGAQSIPLPSALANSGLTVRATSELESGVPEPATWAMMLLGFAGVGMAMRRSRRRSSMLMQLV